ncbi:MAG: 50S ribosomal protein L23 [bacterium]
MKSIYDVIIEPIITEKSTIAKEKSNEIEFVVNRIANKKEIKEAVEKIFKVTVLGVRTINMPGKMRTIRGIHKGLRSGYKKAIIRLKQGDKIEFFQGV